MLRLTDLRRGEIGVVIQLQGGYGLRQKLALRGIREGSWLRIVSSSLGPVVVESDSGQVALGRGMAQRIVMTRRS